MLLAPCPACRRHVVGGACPFCGTAVLAAAPAASPLGRVSRAMVMSAALVGVGAPGCAHKQKPPADEMGEERHHGGGGCIDPDPAKIEELEKRKAAAETDEDKAIIERQLQEARQPMCAPYGAPPSRRRVV